MKCKVVWCKNEAQEGDIYCFRCEDLMDEARQEAKSIREDYENE